MDAEAEPVCSICQMPAVRQDSQWIHAEPADAVFCAILRGETPNVTPEDDDD